MEHIDISPREKFDAAMGSSYCRRFTRPPSGPRYEAKKGRGGSGGNQHAEESAHEAEQAAWSVTQRVKLLTPPVAAQFACAQQNPPEFLRLLGEPAKFRSNLLRGHDGHEKILSFAHW
ncbi:MAG: hypothetical protein M9924_04325 [Rhizobiaceae bacterium]|nr:hypothetical protein [Rhizobiaceae bacterium]